MKPKSVGIRELKDRLSEFVQSVAKGGQDVLITDRGRAVARLTRVDTNVSTARQPMRIRPAVLDHSDLSWMKKRTLPRNSKLRMRDLTAELDFIRADKELP